jgi:hypothetical protein
LSYYFLGSALASERAWLGGGMGFISFLLIGCLSLLYFIISAFLWAAD